MRREQKQDKIRKEKKVMLRLPKLQYLAPQSVDEACSLLRKYEGKVKVMAGGTDLLPSMKQRLFTPEYVLDLRQVSGLREIKNVSNGEVKIGSLCTMSMLEESPMIKEYFPALSDAAGLVAATQIRNMGTIGGNIALETRCRYFNQSHFWRKSIKKCIKRGGEVCHVVKGAKRCYAYFVADTVPALVALKARITIKGGEVERRCFLKEIYTQEGKIPNTLKHTEVITGVILPFPEKGSGSSYKKLRLRKAINFPSVGVAAHVVMDGDTCRNANIVLGAVGSGPMEVTEAENLLKGSLMTDEVIEEVGKMAQKVAQPVANADGRTPEYRRKIAGVFAKSALREAISRARSK
jgi:4-hydroxybenzoyl-CoA reductase subunit beta